MSLVSGYSAGPSAYHYPGSISHEFYSPTNVAAAAAAGVGSTGMGVASRYQWPGGGGSGGNTSPTAQIDTVQSQDMQAAWMAHNAAAVQHHSNNQHQIDSYGGHMDHSHLHHHHNFMGINSLNGHDSYHTHGYHTIVPEQYSQHMHTMYNVMQVDHTQVKVKVLKRKVSSNKKERRRTISINTAFSSLRGCIPNVPTDTKLSKIKTLRLATSYIAYLMDVLNKDDPSNLPENFKAEITKKPESIEERRKREAEVKIYYKFFVFLYLLKYIYSVQA